MKLISGHSPWPSAHSDSQIAEPLAGDLSCDVLVIGAGVVGAFVADALAAGGIETVVVDRRDSAAGSTQASTSLLQYDLDVPLFKLVERIPKGHAARAFHVGVEAIDDLEVATQGLDVGFERRRSLYVASSADAAVELEREYEARKEIGLEVRWAKGDELRSRWGLHVEAAIVSEIAAECDPVRLTDSLLQRAKQRGVRLFEHIDVAEVEVREQLIIRTRTGPTIRCRHLVHAGGYEAVGMLPPGSVDSSATFALLSKPISPPPGIWSDRCLVWEYAAPYLYARRADDRVMVGGEDVRQSFNADCRPMLEEKCAKLRAKFERWFPEVRIDVETSWCGAFLSTRDGMGFIGPIEEGSNILLALCYGGNGMTHAVVAGRLTVDHVMGRKDADAEIFRVRRFS
jgi:glycine/D-amino acid oxidase-like deaminating enzyme